MSLWEDFTECISELKENLRTIAELFLKIRDLEWNNKTCRFWERSQNDNEIQGWLILERFLKLSQRKHRGTLDNPSFDYCPTEGGMLCIKPTEPWYPPLPINSCSFVKTSCPPVLLSKNHLSLLWDPHAKACSPLWKYPESGIRKTLCLCVTLWEPKILQEGSIIGL